MIALREAFRKAKVVVSCAGPFGVQGRHILDAAVAEGRHYLDIRGEIGFAQRLIARDAQAHSRGVAVIGCVGFDVVVSDAAAVMACEALEGRPIWDVRLTVASTTQPSRGSLRTLLGGLQSGDYEWTFADGRVVPAPVGAERWAVSLPPPFERCSATSFGLVEAVVSPRSTADDGEVRAVVVTGGDVGEVTAAAAAICVARAAEANGLPSGFQTPAQAFGARWLLDELSVSGVAWSAAARTSREA